MKNKPHRVPNTKCFICSKPFYLIPSRLKIDSCCSSVCMGLKKKGKSQKELFTNPHSYNKGHTSWNKGRGWREVNCPNCGKINEVLLSQSKGFCNKVCVYTYFKIESPTKYSTIHDRVRQLFGVPNKCENCGTTDSKKFEWANISRSYKTLERDDWARLCCKCHRRYDLGVSNRIEVLCV